MFGCGNVYLIQLRLKSLIGVVVVVVTGKKVAGGCALVRGFEGAGCRELM
jgi:hypothetical protein